MRPQGAYPRPLSFFPLARSCEQSELDVYRDFHPKGWFSKAVRGASPGVDTVLIAPKIVII